MSTKAAEKFRTLLRKDTRYAPEAYNFIYESLDYTIKHIAEKENRKNQHVTGRQLSEGVKQHAIEQFGCLAQAVLNDLGIHTTNDIGELVFNLVEHDLMGKQKTDRKEDFNNIYNFNEVFDLIPIFTYSREKNELRTTYVTRKQYKEKPNHKIPF